MSFRLIPFLAASLALHVSLILPDLVPRSTAPARTLLNASLRTPPPLPSSMADERLLKNTLNSEPGQALTSRPTPTAGSARSPRPADRKADKRTLDSAQRKLSQHLFYPPEAIDRGLQGETRLLLTLDDSGRITDVSIAAGSGHAILDQAAIRAARAMGRVTWSQTRELLLPVVFRLE